MLKSQRGLPWRISDKLKNFFRAGGEQTPKGTCHGESTDEQPDVSPADHDGLAAVGSLRLPWVLVLPCRPNAHEQDEQVEDRDSHKSLDMDGHCRSGMDTCRAHGARTEVRSDSEAFVCPSGVRGFIEQRSLCALPFLINRTFFFLLVHCFRSLTYPVIHMYVYNYIILHSII